MRVLIVYNPISGSGRAERAAGQIHERLAQARHEPTLLATELGDPADWLAPSLAEKELLVVVGGDGAMRMAAPNAVATETPIYHYPGGTENLFSREFGMSRDIDDLLRAIDAASYVSVDIATANDEPFLLMTSIGMDAEVVHDLARRRVGAISHLTYVRPILKQLRRWRPPRLRITVDGERVDDDQSGGVIVANCRQYMSRLDPAYRASMSDGLLDVVHMRDSSRFDIVRRMIRYARSRHQNDHKTRCVTGRDICIECDQPQRYQLDGDVPNHTSASENSDQVESLHIAIQPQALRVLKPVKD